MLDVEGVLTPEVWIAVAERTGIDFLRRTTRDEPDYDVLMKGRIAALDAAGITMTTIMDVVAGLAPLDGALDFLAGTPVAYACGAAVGHLRAVRPPADGATGVASAAVSHAGGGGRLHRRLPAASAGPEGEGRRGPSAHSTIGCWRWGTPTTT